MAGHIVKENDMSKHKPATFVAVRKVVRDTNLAEMLREKASKCLVSLCDDEFSGMNEVSEIKPIDGNGICVTCKSGRAIGYWPHSWRPASFVVREDGN